MAFRTYGRELAEYCHMSEGAPGRYSWRRMACRCSWLHCGASFEGHPVAARHAGWGLVCRQTSTGEQVVVCPEHVQELLDADLRALLRMFEEPGSSRTVPRVYPEEDGAPEVTVRLGPLKGRVVDDDDRGL
jgi:hypothetical protein